jgi:rare lipoprotein A
MMAQRGGRSHVLLSLLLLAFLSACGSTSSSPPYQGIKIGKPYVVAGHEYVPKYVPDYDETGVASWYGPGFHGGHTASGERYNQNDLTAAHKTLPLPSLVRVTNLDNGRSAVIRVNDRGPFVHSRIIDLSRASAEKLGVLRTGTAKVRVQFLDKETREYVSNLPNGAASLAALDRFRALQAAKSGVTEQAAPEIFPPTQLGDVEPLPFIAPAPVLQGGDRVNSQYYTGVPSPQKADGTTAGRPPAVPDVSAPPSVARSGYYVRAGTFGLKDNAHRLAKRMLEMGNAQVVESRMKAKLFYCVLAGPYNSRADAERMIGALDRMGVIGAKLMKL